MTYLQNQRQAISLHWEVRLRQWPYDEANALITTNVDSPVWYVIVGAILVVMALAFSKIKQLPLTASTVYLAVGYLLSRTGVLAIESVAAAPAIEIVSEIVVLISIFTVGLKLSVPWGETGWAATATAGDAFAGADRRRNRGEWRGSIRSVVGSRDLARRDLGAYRSGAGLRCAVNSAARSRSVAICADSGRRHERWVGVSRWSCSVSACWGCTTSAAWGWRWLSVDLLWAVVAGLTVGATFGWVISKICLFFRRRHREAVGLDDFFAMGLIALSYGAALLIHAYGFLAVFAAGAALRRLEFTETSRVGSDINPDADLAAPEAAVHPHKAPAYMARAVLTFNEHLERIGEVVVVILVGALLGEADWSWRVMVLGGLMFLVIRPLSVRFGLLGEGASVVQRRYMGWFGIRGIGSVYYLFYAINHGLDPAMAQRLVSITVALVTISVFIHGISVTPLMSLYAQHMERRQSRRGVATAQR